MAETKAQIHLKAIDGISGVLKSASGAMGGFSDGVKNASAKLSVFNQLNKESFKKMRQIGKSVGSVGRSMALSVTAPVVAAAAGSVKAFSDFDDGMRSVKTLLDSASFASGDVEQGFGAMQKEMLALFRNSSQPMDAMVKGLFDTVSAGISAADAVGVLAISSKLAVAGATDVAVATDGMTSAMNAWGYAATDAEAVAAKFFTAQKRGKTTVAELASNLGKVASVAATAGVSLDQVLAVVSASTLAGVRTSEAFTGLKAVMSNIIKPTSEAKLAIEALNAGLKDNEKIDFSSAGLKKKGLTTFLQDILKNAKRIGVEPSRAIEILFGSIEALGIAQAITGNQQKSYIEIQKELIDDTKNVTTLNKANEEQSKSFTQQILRLKSAFSGLGIEMASGFAPELEDMTAQLGAFTKFAENNPGLINMTAKFALLAAVVGPILIGLGWLITALPAIATLFSVLISPITLVGIALAGVVAMLYALWQNWDRVKDFFKIKFDQIFNPFGNADANAQSGSAADRRLQRSVPEFGPPRSAMPGAPVNPIAGNASIDINFSNIPKGTEVKVDKAGFPKFFDINTGLQGASGL